MYQYNVIIESNREIHAFLCDLYTFLQSYDAMTRTKPAYLEVQMMKLNFLPYRHPSLLTRVDSSANQEKANVRVQGTEINCEVRHKQTQSRLSHENETCARESARTHYKHTHD